MKKRFLLSAIFLVTGVLIYFIFDIRVISKSNVFLSLIRNYIPDVCWAISFFFACINFTKQVTKNDLIVNSLYVFSLGLLFEFLQLLKISKGTFDIIDIIIYLFAIIVATLIEIFLRRKEDV